MDDQNQNKNLILATVLSFIVIFAWFILFPPPETPVTSEVPASEVMPPEAASVVPVKPATENFVSAPRVKIDTPRLEGTISLAGGRIDDLLLKGYRETQAPNAPQVRLLSPVGQPNPYYAVYGWAQGGGLAPDDVPSATTQWALAEGDALSVGKPVVLRWENGKGLVFTRKIAIDEHYMFNITDHVQNNSPQPAVLQHYGQIVRYGKPLDLQNFFVLHEGVVGRVDGKLREIDYDDITDFALNDKERANAEIIEGTTDGWLGFTDKYWMTVMVPEQGKPFEAVVKHSQTADIYQTDMRTPAATLAPGAQLEVGSRLFAGAKEWETIRNYQNEPGMTAQLFGAKADPNIAPVPGFIDSIDWGWFFFLTKPIFWLLHHLHGLIGNMGLAIIALTFVLKFLVLPLAYKSYVSMARMKELQPEMEEMKARIGDDRAKMQREMMQLYKDRKVNPAAGCLPILIQIPIFFSLYKVIFVTLELRQAPFYGWLTDLSMPDSSTLFNFFGLLPWAAPEAGSLLATIFIGILPILLGISMWLQQKLNPAPADPAQAMIFAWMPWIFMFMLGSFASGLVLYWITNNTITFVQQYLIMRSHGHKPDIFGNIKSSFRKKPALEDAKKP